MADGDTYSARFRRAFVRLGPGAGIFSFAIHRFAVNTHIVKSKKHTFAAQWLLGFVRYLFASGTHAR